MTLVSGNCNSKNFSGVLILNSFVTVLPDITNAHWSKNLKLEISEGEIISIEDMPAKAKLQYLYEGMLPNTFNVLKALI